jgi:subtilisin family serine protease
MPDRLLVKLRPGGALRAASSPLPIEPLYEASATLAGTATAQWFLVQPADSATPWDAAHDRLAAQLGVGEGEVIFAEPDLIHDIYKDTNERPLDQPFAVGEACDNTPQDGTHGKATGAGFDWHLDAAHSQLAAARETVTFASPRTRIAHIDTGYSRMHETVPQHINRALERSFVEADANPGSAEDPDRQVPILDNSGHGTGTIGILAGKRSSVHGAIIGAAPGAEVVPLRVADRVVLLRTSALARAFRYAADRQCDVVSLSMGGLPSEAWREAVDAVYEAGVCICAAAGNHIGASPPQTLVYPARYPRVVAVCGAMADGSPYADLKGLELEGSHGPESAMGAALAAYTPNIPWARFGCDTAVRLDGEGTSAATPQVAAAVALWFEKHKAALPRDWRRVEAVRYALFSTAKLHTRKSFFGNGVLQARAALDVQPVLTLPKSPESRNAFAFLRLITGLGAAEPPPRERMFNLELAQRWLVNPTLQQLVPDPDRTPTLTPKDLRKVMDAVIADSGASTALRKHVARRYPVLTGVPARSTPPTRDIVPDDAVACQKPPALRDPTSRRLRVYAVDASFSTRLDTADSNEVALRVRWERLTPGPAGEYFRVEDVDASGTRYDPVDLDEPQLLAQDGWAPSEGNPQFHQQMVYAVAMRTVEHFERALGRPVLWSPEPNPRDPHDDSRYHGQLIIRPHALRQANAYFSPEQAALLFGYFDVDDSQPGTQMPGSRIFTCLSHDIVAHETTHAILDGMHRRFTEPSNPDVLAFHEAFADIVALLQHFTIPDILVREIRRTRGNLEAESMLGSLAIQFGRASGGQRALREAIGRIEHGVWHRNEPDPTALHQRLEPHARGAILVAAVFDAFLACYNAKTADLFRLATGGTGVLPAGAIHPDLVRRLADEASTVARQVLDMCIRAIDYLPPVDVTFFEYLRALITADLDVVAEDRLNYRVAFVEAFRRHGIYPVDLTSGGASENTPRTLSVDTLRWRGIDLGELTPAVQKAVEAAYRNIVLRLRVFADETLYHADRKKLFDASREERRNLHRRLKNAFRRVPAFARQLGMDPRLTFEVHQLHAAMRVGQNGRPTPQLIVRLTQETALKGAIGGTFRGGSTLVIDLTAAEVKYCIGKGVNSQPRQRRTLEFHAGVGADPLQRLLLAGDGREPFGLLHAFGDHV